MTYHRFQSDEPGESFGSFEVFQNACGNWLWASGFPGYLWDSDPVGPFDTEEEAYADAQDFARGGN